MVQNMFLDTCAPATIGVLLPKIGIEEWFQKYGKSLPASKLQIPQLH
jgi:hypothetical protein